MQIFSHKDAGSHHLLLTYFWGVNVLQASVYVHIRLFLFVKGNEVEED